MLNKHLWNDLVNEPVLFLKSSYTKEYSKGENVFLGSNLSVVLLNLLVVIRDPHLFSGPFPPFIPSFILLARICSQSGGRATTGQFLSPSVILLALPFDIVAVMALGQPPLSLI